MHAARGALRRWVDGGEGSPIRAAKCNSEDCRHRGGLVECPFMAAPCPTVVRGVTAGVRCMQEA